MAVGVETGTKPPGYYDHARPDVAQHVPPGTKRLLDVGCGSGAFGAFCKQHVGVPYVAGLDLDIDRAMGAGLDLVCEFDIQTCDTEYLRDKCDGRFDCIAFNDVLEHTIYPEDVLIDFAAELLDEAGTILISLPNVRFFPVLQMHAEGHWAYQDAGVMDRTHLRFFALPQMIDLVEEANLEVAGIHALSMVDPKTAPPLIDGTFRVGRLTLTGLTEKEYLDLLTVQYLLVAKPRWHRYDSMEIVPLEPGEAV